MPRRRRPERRVPHDVAVARNAFDAVLASVEAAKRSLLSAVPRGRGAGAPLGEAVFGFEAELAAARDRMGAWRLPSLEDVWTACRRALEESLRRSERLRLEASPEGYAELAPILAALMEPLEAFQRAMDAFGQLGA